MNVHEGNVRKRAIRLLSCYPREWRDRYGEEFIEFLVADLQEQPHSLGRSVDVVRSGLLARLAVLGFAGRSLDSADDGRRSLAAFGTSIAIFLPVALAIWAQLTIGWQWSSPKSGTTFSAMLVMTVGMLVVVAACVVCAAPVAWSAVRSLVSGTSSRVARPLCLLAFGLVVLIVGTHHFANGWPGTYGHRWAHQGIVPGGVAAYAWASTLFVTSYWLHPAALAHFPGTEVAWMVVSPFAVAAVVVGAAKTVRRLDFSQGLLRFERSLGYVIASAMALFFTGAALWVIDGGVGPRNLFHTGVIDVVDLAIMVTSLTIAGRTLERTGGASLTSASR
jgi:hypothetical protein